MMEFNGSLSSKGLKQNPPQNKTDLKKCIISAGSKRIRPLIMTTTTTVMALMPVMFATGTGAEVMKPWPYPPSEVCSLDSSPFLLSLFCFLIVKKKRCSESLKAPKQPISLDPI